MTPIDTTATLILLHLMRINALEHEWRTRLFPGRAMQNDDLLTFWNGRPKDKPLPLRSHGVYIFDSSRGISGGMVHLNPVLYRPVDWRGLL